MISGTTQMSVLKSKNNHKHRVYGSPSACTDPGVKRSKVSMAAGMGLHVDMSARVSSPLLLLQVHLPLMNLCDVLHCEPSRCISTINKYQSLLTTLTTTAKCCNNRLSLVDCI